MGDNDNAPSQCAQCDKFPFTVSGPIIVESYGLSIKNKLRVLKTQSMLDTVGSVLHRVPLVFHDLLYIHLYIITSEISK